jgi:hypothetical protein
MFKKLVYVSMMIFICLSLTEIALQVVDFLMPNRIMSNIDPIIIDPILGHRPNPRHPEHDKKGFRNASLPARVDIVALGDSQTYGTGVPRENAWPQQLATMAGIKVYNMAFGGYCPVQSLLLLEEALEMKPKIVVEAFYAGNDLYEAFAIVYSGNDQLNNLKTTDKATLKEIQKLQQQQVIANITTTADVNIDQDTKLTFLAKLKQFGYDHFKIYRLLTFTKHSVFKIATYNNNQLWEQYKSISNYKYFNKAVPFEYKNIRTILTPTYRLSVLNLDDMRISEGLAICLKSIKLMHDKLAREEIEFYVLFIPTKELVFSGLANHINSSNYAKLIANEKMMWENTRRFLQQNDIKYIDSLQFLQKQLEEGRQPYPIYDDGHPNKHGQQAIAEAVFGFLKQTSFNKTNLTALAQGAAWFTRTTGGAP